MRHLEAGRKLGVNPDHRRALLRNLTIALIEQDCIRTSVPRAKELRWFAERVVTLAKRGNVAGRRRIVQILGSTQNSHNNENRIRKAIARVYSDLVPRFKDRSGGYTQILKLARTRPGDNSPRCLIRYIPDLDKKKAKDSGSKTKKSASKVKAKAADHDHDHEGHDHVHAHEDKPKATKKVKAKPMADRETGVSDKPVAKKTKAKESEEKDK